jgi:hypothetical protein
VWGRAPRPFRPSVARQVLGHGLARIITEHPWKSAKSVADFLEEEVNELQFRIKEQDYFLAFVEQEKRWYLFAPTPTGVRRIPVYVDEVRYGRIISERATPKLSS